MEAATMRQRAEIISRVRSFFTERGHLEVDTPLLAPRLIPEPAIEVFPARWRDRSGAPERELYLVPSPELWMKRLLATGSGSIFQVCHCFRNVEEQSRHHSPEFTMLEWYTLGYDYLDSALLTEALLREVGVERPVCRRSMAELFRAEAGLELAELGDTRALQSAVERLGIPVGPASDWEECFNKAFLTFVEPSLARQGCVFVTDYPAAIPTLARRKAGTPWAERWELYLDGVEVANCYTEETDPKALRLLFEHESARKAAALVPHPPDLAVASLPLPPCSGGALGLDRLIMIATSHTSIEEVIFFPGFGIL